ncbi:hypothetical protein [Roseinatronobacter sp.]
MISTASYDISSERPPQPQRGRAVVLLMLFALIGAVLGAAAAFALGKTLGVVALAYIAGGSGFYFIGAITFYVSSTNLSRSDA